MTQTVCFVRSDLSFVRRFGPGGESSWTANPIAETERDQVRPLLDRVRAAAAWCASGPGRRKLDRVVIDVDESVCLMVRTPSTARPVLAASVRSGSQDWGDLAPVSGLEPLVDPPTRPAKRKKDDPESAPGTESEGVSVAVISQTDALTRLWLDAMDARGVRATDVLSLWHAAAQAWGPRGEALPGGGGGGGGESALILLCEPERVVWAMARGADLLCGGSAAIATAAPSPEPASESPPTKTADPLETALRRCALDWLTWAGQFGLMPDRVVVVGSRAGAAAELLPAGWRNPHPPASGGSGSSVEVHVDADPVALTCARLAQRPAEAGRPRARRSLVRLAARPTRATRWRYGWAAAALVILGLGFGGVGYRMAKAGNEVRATSAELRERTLARAKTIVPNLPPNTNVVWELEAAVGNLKQAPAFAAPTPPPRIFDEITRVAGALSQFPGARLRSIYLAGDGGRLTCSVTERRDNELLITALREGGAMEWTAPRDSSTDFTTLNLNGAWRK